MENETVETNETEVCEEQEIECECAISAFACINVLLLGTLFIGFLTFWCYMAYRNERPKLVTGYMNVPDECITRSITGEEMIKYSCNTRVEVRLIDERY